MPKFYVKFVYKVKGLVKTWDGTYTTYSGALNRYHFMRQRIADWANNGYELVTSELRRVEA